MKFRSFVMAAVVLAVTVPATAQTNFIAGKNKIRYDTFEWKVYDTPHFQISYYDRGEPYRVVERPAATDGCTLAESPIYLPDGRTQKRFVRVCPDANGNFQVVD